MDDLDQAIEKSMAAPTKPDRKRIAIHARTPARQKFAQEQHAKKKLGRPSAYTQKIADRICEDLSNGKTLTKICEELKLSNYCVYQWLEKYPIFKERYDQSRSSMSKTLIDKIIDESESISPETAIAHKVKAGIYQWVASKYNPALFSESRRIELKGEIHHKHSHELSEAQKQRIAESWLMSQQPPAIEAETSGPDIPAVQLLENDGVREICETEQREVPQRKRTATTEPRRIVKGKAGRSRKPKPDLEKDPDQTD